MKRRHTSRASQPPVSLSTGAGAAVASPIRSSFAAGVDVRSSVAIELGAFVIVGSRGRDHPCAATLLSRYRSEVSYLDQVPQNSRAQFSVPNFSVNRRQPFQGLVTGNWHEVMGASQLVSPAHDACTR